jgi:amidohydrolase
LFALLVEEMTESLQSSKSLKEAVIARVDEISASAAALSRRIHRHPEVAYEEHQASRWLADFLAENGFAVDVGVCDVETAFVARFTGGAGPTIALMAEYDALPGIGHGCGHNLICSAACAAASALVAAWPSMPGAVVVIGTPAEEGGGGKIRLLEGGAFRGVDVSMMFHPANRTVPNYLSLAASHLRVQFYGRAAHSAAEPWMGENAADAAMLFFAGVNAFRQHVRPDVRMHGIITDGGARPNVVPERSCVEFMVRAERSSVMEEAMHRVIDIAEGAAQMTRTRVVADRGITYMDAVRCPTLVELTEENFAVAGVGGEPFSPDQPRASSDAGNVSHVIPTHGFLMAIADAGVPGHSEQNRDAAGSDRGQAAMLAAAKVLALNCVDLLARPALVDRVKSEHAAQV